MFIGEQEVGIECSIFTSCASGYHVPKRSAGHDLMGMNLGETILELPPACRVESPGRTSQCCIQEVPSLLML